jgi:hypothetical protein
MRKSIRYTDEPLGRLKGVPDFLPHPDDLVFRDERAKATASSRAGGRSRAPRARAAGHRANRLR